MTSSTTKTDLSPPAEPAEPKAFRCVRAILVFAALTGAGLAADLATKHYAFTALLAERGNLAVEAQLVRAKLLRLTGAEPSSKDVLHALNIHRPLALGAKLTLSTNPGVVFGLLLPRWAVIVATLAVTGVVGVIFATSPAHQRWLHAAMGFILAGALGNLYDRLLGSVHLPGLEPIQRQVRDFLDFSAWGYPWVFNVADALLVVGVGMIVLHSLVHWRSPRKAE